MKSVIFVSGTASGIGKTVVSAIIAEALRADYWKPVHAGCDRMTDTEWVKRIISNPQTVVHPEVYKLKNPVSPHLAAKEDGVKISLEKIFAAYCLLPSSNDTLVVEGTGGLVVPLNETEFVTDLVRVLNARVILVTSNYADSINHSLLTSKVSRQKNLRVLGWMFNDKPVKYESEITRWIGFPAIASIPKFETITKEIIAETAATIRENIIQVLPSPHVEGRSTHIIP